MSSQIIPFQKSQIFGKVIFFSQNSHIMVCSRMQRDAFVTKRGRTNIYRTMKDGYYLVNHYTTSPQCIEDTGTKPRRKVHFDVRHIPGDRFSGLSYRSTRFEIADMFKAVFDDGFDLKTVLT